MWLDAVAEPVPTAWATAAAERFAVGSSFRVALKAAVVFEPIARIVVVAGGFDITVDGTDITARSEVFNHSVQLALRVHLPVLVAQLLDVAHQPGVSTGVIATCSAFSDEPPSRQRRVAIAEALSGIRSTAIVLVWVPIGWQCFGRARVAREPGVPNACTRTTVVACRATAQVRYLLLQLG